MPVDTREKLRAVTRDLGSQARVARLLGVSPFRPGARTNAEGGALFVARHLQGLGRHDNPGQFGVLYASRDPESGVAELLARFRGQEVTERDLRRADGLAYAVAELDDALL